MTPAECYLTNVGQLWREELTQASVNASKVIICSPYLTSPTADAVISSAPAEHCEIYTRFSVEDFAAGSSSLRTLKNLLKKGYRVFSIDNLHAKIVLASDCFVSIGSQNLTAQGRQNREATVISKSPDAVAQVTALLRPWIAQRHEITLDIVTDLESKLPRLAKRFATLRKVAQQIELKVQQEEEQRVAREIHRQQRQNQVNEARSMLHRLFPNGKISRKVAQVFIGGSTWIPNHKSGKPVPAKGYSSRVYEIAGDQRVNFGKNTFLVGRAIQKCTKTVGKYLNSFEVEQPWSRKDLIHCLFLDVRGAVQIGGKEYPGYHYPLWRGDHMKFNWYSIKVTFFVNFFLALLQQCGLLKDLSE